MNQIILIAAVAENGVIGNDGTIPWEGKLRADMRRFKSLTMGHPVIMGRKTYDSLKRALPGRKNIVLSRDRAFALADAFVVRHISEALAFADQADKMFVLGGAEIYKLFLPFADRIELTRVHATPSGAVHFPQFPIAFTEIRKEQHTKDAENVFDYDFVTLVRQEPAAGLYIE